MSKNKYGNLRGISLVLAGSIIGGALGMSGCSVNNVGTDSDVTTVSDSIDDNKVYSVNIKLLDKDTKDYVIGAVLVLKDSSDRIIARWTTDNISFGINGLEDGIYTLTQSSSSDGYHLNEEVITFEVKNNDLLDVVMYNTKMTEKEIEKANEIIGNLVDVFDNDYKRNINGEYYVLRLRDAYKLYCERNPQSNTIDVETVPKYLFLKGTPFEVRRKYKNEIEYEFANWNDDISSTKDWKTDVSLVRIRESDFALYLYYAKDLKCDSFGFSIGLKDSYDYLKPISQLTELEIKEVIEQYENNKDVISIIENNHKNVSLNDDDFYEDYYVYDMGCAWDYMSMGSANTYCACFDIEKDNHNCALTSNNLGSQISLPRYFLLKISDVKDGCYCLSNFNGDSGSFVIADIGGEEYNIVMNDITIPLTDLLRKEKASYCNVPDGANAIVLHGKANVFGNYLKPLSSLSKYEVEKLCDVYGYNDDVISIINEYWYGPLTTEEENISDGPVMSNGLTKIMNEAILRGVEVASVKSKILRRRGI